MTHRRSMILLISLAFLVGCATTAPENLVTVEARAEPEVATITLKGREIGQTPVTFSVESLDELVDVVAVHPEVEAVEKRIRFLGPQTAQVIFRFDLEASEMAKALGLAKILVFDYSDRAAFDSDSHEIKPEFMSMLESQASVLNRSFAGLDVYVCGHTDSTGSNDHNLVLSLNRAEAVSSVLEGHGVEKDRMKIQGFASDYPLAPNTTREGRALNRRTEVILPQ